MMRTQIKPQNATHVLTPLVSIPARLVAFILLALLAPLGLLFAGLIWLEDGGPVLTGSLLEGATDGSNVPAFRVATLHLEKWDIRQLPASMGNPDRLILIPTLTVIGRILTLLNLDRLPAMLLVALGRLAPSVVLRPRSIYSS
jgi:lipopolysaccharide/colanic/teichoic acid biosynthesis glycosyltransferase